MLGAPAIAGPPESTSAPATTTVARTTSRLAVLMSIDPSFAVPSRGTSKCDVDDLARPQQEVLHLVGCRDALDLSSGSRNLVPRPSVRDGPGRRVRVAVIPAHRAPTLRAHRHTRRGGGSRDRGVRNCYPVVVVPSGSTCVRARNPGNGTPWSAEGKPVRPALLQRATDHTQVRHAWWPASLGCWPHAPR